MPQKVITICVTFQENLNLMQTLSFLLWPTDSTLCHKHILCVRVGLMLRSYSPIGSGSVSKESLGQSLDRRYRWDFHVPGGKGRGKVGKGEFLPCLGGRKMEQPCEVLGEAGACGMLEEPRS